MDNWDQGAVDLVEPGFIEFDEDGLGELGFIAVTGELDCCDADRDGRPGVEFSWQGSDEGDDVAAVAAGPRSTPTARSTVTSTSTSVTIPRSAPSGLSHGVRVRGNYTHVGSSGVREGRHGSDSPSRSLSFLEKARTYS